MNHIESYPALTQSNLEYVIQEDPYHIKQKYVEKETTNLSNYQNYVLQAQSSKHWKEVEFEGFTLPAQAQAKAYCLKWVSWGCDNTKEHPKNKHYAEHEIKTCKVASCPKCFESWINRQANRSTRRFSKFVEKKQYNFRHIILSPPSNQVEKMSYNSMKKMLSIVLKIANIKTCAVVFHPFRFQDQRKSMPYFSPHFHLLAYGKVTNTTEFHNKTKFGTNNGWLIKNKGNMESEVDIFNCVRYLLSHCGVRKKTHAIRYLGDISYRKLKVEKEPFLHNCPYCELPLRIFRIKFDSKHEPPPIDHVGLWESDCFEAIDPHDPEAKIPFYQMKEEPENNRDYEEEMIYSFEELLRISLNLPKISDRYNELSMFDHVTGRKCQKITDF
ncbi:MAG: hypothetical protein MAG458_00249 [Nitrosopumilus sp.]|nr:hypothetical protein [Nitrosopumilus sp.]